MASPSSFTLTMTSLSDSFARRGRIRAITRTVLIVVPSQVNMPGVYYRIFGGSKSNVRERIAVSPARYTCGSGLSLCRDPLSNGVVYFVGVVKRDETNLVRITMVALATDPSVNCIPRHLTANTT